MSVLLALLVIALVGLGGWLLFALHRLQREIAELRGRLQSLPPLPPVAAGGKSRITIEILNPFELAARETRFATAAARLAPRMIEGIVYERAAVMIAQQMAEQGVVAEVKAHVA